MRRDATRFRSICIRPYGAGQARAKYMEYLDGVSDYLKQGNGNPSPGDPKKIARVFAARHLSKSGPASYSYASFDFRT